MTDNSDLIKKNIKAHDNVVKKYEQKHGEIFNEIEQDRLFNELRDILKFIETQDNKKLALDFGCGTGNMTKFLAKSGIKTVSADVSIKSLKYIKNKYVNTEQIYPLFINGSDLSNIKDKQFNIVVTYSVLHHIPDYLKIVEEFARVVKPGGIIYIDHENSPGFWDQSKEYQEFISLNKRKWKRLLCLLDPRWYYVRFRSLLNPRYQPEGDIHVYKDDHIEWDKIEKILAETDCSIIKKKDYLLYKKKYFKEIYQKYKDKCSDMRLLVIRKS
ncbi:class I SAM-dependent methyltransferase [candidate division KSB1 bacterium]